MCLRRGEAPACPCLYLGAVFVRIEPAFELFGRPLCTGYAAFGPRINHHQGQEKQHGKKDETIVTAIVLGPGDHTCSAWVGLENFRLCHCFVALLDRAQCLETNTGARTVSTKGGELSTGRLAIRETAEAR